MMRALIHVLAMAAAVAGIVHITTVLLMPAYAQRDAWAVVAQAAPLHDVRLLARPWAPPRGDVPNQLQDDPAFATAACRFDLADGPVALEGDGDVPFWSASVFDRSGRNVFSINDRTAIGRRLDVLVLDPAQEAQLKEASVTGFESAIKVVTPVAQGFVVLRAAAPERTQAARAVEFLDGATCERVTIEG